MRSTAKKLLSRVPPLRHALERRYRRWFATPQATGACLGAWPDFAAARAAVPRGVHGDYDTPEAATKYADRMGQIESDDYPAVFWLSRALDGGARSVVDFGGHVGVAWYAWHETLGVDDLRWTVCDVPAVVAEGTRLAKERGHDGLRFTTDLASAAGADVFLAQGSLQYVEPTLGELLDLAGRPPHLLIHRTPVRASGRTVWTLQNIGSAICPYALHSRDELLAFAASRGYRLVASWHSARGLHVPFHPELGDVAYSGFYLQRDTSAAAEPPA
ncbi:MAG: methyltransferase, TIGR04325 family [Deltaproteobacteria bacterium]|nr:methyltransferase, TIGR04325 family [Deltaproteobacteria bacterium]MCB9788863.1 methyltransferase, TIGR04325 family [Deltaproteobacteria bacterium]